MKTVRRLLAASGTVLGVAMLGALFGAASAQAQTRNIAVVVICTSSGEVCSPSFATTFTPPAAGPANLSFTASTSGCSNAQVAFTVDGTLVGTTAFLAPGQTGLVTTGSLSATSHTVALQATGEVGGCNSGTLGSWGGTLTVPAALSSTPAPATWLLAALGVAALSLYQAKDKLADLIARSR